MARGEKKEERKGKTETAGERNWNKPGQHPRTKFLVLMVSDCEVETIPLTAVHSCVTITAPAHPGATIPGIR